MNRNHAVIFAVLCIGIVLGAMGALCILLIAMLALPLDYPQAVRITSYGTIALMAVAAFLAVKFSYKANGFNEKDPA